MTSRDPQHIQLSLELLQLLYWMTEHEQETLKQMMARATAHYAISPLTPEQLAATTEDHIKDHVLHFFQSLEELLQETRDEADATEQLRRFLVPAVSRIDGTQCDIETITRSAEKAKSAIEKGTTHNSKEALCQALIKQWHPHVSKQDRH